MKSEPFISIIVLENYYPDGKFIRCLRSYTNQRYNNYEIILVLWGKKEFNNIPKLLKDNNISMEKIKIFEYEEDPGYARGNNLGVKHSNADFIIISNPDIETKPDFLSKIINSFFFMKGNKHTDKIILGPRICNYNGIIEYSRRMCNFLGFGAIDISKTNKIRRTQITSGCCFLIKKKYYEKLRGFDEEYFMYKDDIDFSLRATKLGMQQYVDNSIHLFHLRTDEEYKLNNFKYFFHERNRIRLCLEHTTKKKKMLIAQLVFEPVHLFYAIKNGFLRSRLRIYKYFCSHLIKILRNKEKENNFFDNDYDMRGIFNEVNINSFIYRILNYYSKMIFYFYHH